MKTFEALARDICMDAGINPDRFPDNVSTGPYGLPYPDYAPDGIQRPWHKFAVEAKHFLSMYLYMRRHHHD
jgi:hypothetical protein